ncbi:MAG: hypothetical protein ABWX71_06205 [Aeromicrobium sp.]
MTLERKTPMKRGGELARRPMGRAGARPRTKKSTPKRRNTGPTATVSSIVWARAGGRCELCGGSLAGVIGFSKHHRLPRRMGGSSRPELNTPANLIMLCGSGTTGCHGRVESRREQAYAEGLLLHDGADPATVPVLLLPSTHAFAELVYLTVDGTYSPDAPDQEKP